jgi:predicted nucleic acid-binding protein
LIAASASGQVAYLDSSALVKLIAAEPETAALRCELSRWPQRTSSRLAVVEITRAASRLGPQAQALAPQVLSGLRLLAIDPVIATAAAIGTPMLRSLDAIHLATAAGIAHEIGIAITYDKRMLVEAPTLGLPVIAPS